MIYSKGGDLSKDDSLKSDFSRSLCRARLLNIWFRIHRSKPVSFDWAQNTNLLTFIDWCLC